MEDMISLSEDLHANEYRLADVAVYPTDDNYAVVHIRSTKATRRLHVTYVALLMQCREFKLLDEHLAAFCQGKQLTERVLQGLRSDLYHLAQDGYLISRHQHSAHFNEMLLRQTYKSTSGNSAAHLYLDLMKRCLVNWIYMDGNLQKQYFMNQLNQDEKLKSPLVFDFDPEERIKGRDWPENAHTMIGFERLDNLQFCVEDVLAKDIPGDLIETGVWRGGATIFMRAILRVYGVQNRSVWVADSFQGLPPPNPEKYPADMGDIHHTYKELATSLDQVQANFARYGLLDEHVRFLKGWFKETLPGAPIEQLAVLRLDGDMYESTMDALVSLYPKLSSGGYLIVDDYGSVLGCRQAIHDYRAAQGIQDEIMPIDGLGVYWQRS